MGAAKYKCGMVVVYVSARCNSEAQLKECSMLDEDARRRDAQGGIERQHRYRPAYRWEMRGLK